MGGRDSKTSKWCDKISPKNDDAVDADDADDAAAEDTAAAVENSAAAEDTAAAANEYASSTATEGSEDCNIEGHLTYCYPSMELSPDAVLSPDKESGTAGGAIFAGEDSADEDAAGEDSADEYKDAAGAGEDAMDVATRAAIRSAGGEAPSADVVADARARASELLTTMTSNDEAGLKDLQNLTLSMGLPSTRSMFKCMIENSNLRGVAKKDAIRAVADFSPVSESGCMKVDFFNQALGAPDIAYLVLHKCPRDHNLEAQLNKLKPHVLAEKWAEVTRSLSMLIYIGRSVYGQIARANLGLIRDIHGAAADDPCTDYLDLKVDVENTTLYLDASWPSRIGIYVRLGAEVEGNKSNA